MTQLPRWLRGIIGVTVLDLGAVWTLQGLNVVRGSFMSGQTTWLAIGVVVGLLGVGLLWSLTSGGGSASAT